MLIFHHRFFLASAAWLVFPMLLSTPGLLKAGGGPVNDDFANRTVLSGAMDDDDSSNSGATLEAGERTETGFKTVWYEWSAPESGLLSVLGQSAFNGQVSVFTGTGLSDMKLAGMVGTSTFARSQNIPVAPGTSYFIAFGGVTMADDGNFTLTVTLDTTSARGAAINALHATSATGANDDFADRETLTGDNVTGIGYRFDATREGGEDLSHGQRTAWWSWMAPSDGVTKFSNEFSEGSERLSIYTGDTFGALTLVRSRIFSGNDTEVEILTESGVIYQIVVGDSQLNPVRYHNVLTITHTSPIPRAQFRFPARTLRRKTAMAGEVLNPVVADSVTCRSRGNGRCQNLTFNPNTGFFTFKHRQKNRYRPSFVIYTMTAFLDGQPNGIKRKRFKVSVKPKR